MDMIYEKFDSIIENVENEFKYTEEYRISNKHKEIINKYLENKRAFEKYMVRILMIIVMTYLESLNKSKN